MDSYSKRLPDREPEKYSWKVPGETRPKAWFGNRTTTRGGQWLKAKKQSKNPRRPIPLRAVSHCAVRFLTFFP